MPSNPGLPAGKEAMEVAGCLLQFEAHFVGRFLAGKQNPAKQPGERVICHFLVDGDGASPLVILLFIYESFPIKPGKVI